MIILGFYVSKPKPNLPLSGTDCQAAWEAAGTEEAGKESRAGRRRAGRQRAWRRRAGRRRVWRLAANREADAGSGRKWGGPK